MVLTFLNFRPADKSDINVALQGGEKMGDVTSVMWRMVWSEFDQPLIPNLTLATCWWRAERQ